MAGSRGLFYIDLNEGKNPPDRTNRDVHDFFEKDFRLLR